MPWKSRWSVDIPIQSLPSFVFQSPDGPLEHKPILIDAEKPEYSLSRHTYRQWVKRLALGLQRAGFAPGDRLLLYSGNTIFFPVVLMGTIAAGGIFSGANPSYVARELAYQLQDCGAKFLIAAEGSLETALEAARSIGFPQDRVFAFDDGFATFDGRTQPVKGIQPWTSLLAPASQAASFRWETFTTREQMERTVVLNYSSGTTGLPKGVEITHLNYIANCQQTIFMADLDDAKAVEETVGLSFLPMYHAYGQTAHCVTTVIKGNRVYIMRKFDFVEMLKYIARYRVTDLTLVPPIVVALTKHPEVRKYDLSSVTSAVCGAAPLGKESQQEFNAQLGDRFVGLRQGWGLTEVTCSATGWDPRSPIRSGAIGELNPNLEAMLVDDDGVEVHGAVRGELWVRGPNVMKGYWRKPEATRETKTADGWLKTGDIAYKDENGLIYIVDRKKELIKVRGNQVAPAELEALLLEHPAIQDAAVIGITIGGEELPRAYVVLQEKQKATAQEIANWVSQKVSRHKRLAGGVVVTSFIPKNPSGKILRKLLRDDAKTEIGDGPRRQIRL